MDLKGLQVTWLGHGTFKFRAPSGQIALLDAWVEDNPACPADQKRIGKLDLMLITHGHFDHIGNAITVAEESRPDRVIGIVELASWLEKKGVQNTLGMNKGGTVDLGWVRVTMVHADHSCGIQDGDQAVYGGEAVGFVLSFQNGPRVYAAGDTNVFGDMRIIGELYQPEVAILPIGDFFTMGPAEAAYAAQLLNAPVVIPAHFGTFPALTGTPAALREALSARGVDHIEVVDVHPGDSLS